MTRVCSTPDYISKPGSGCTSLPLRLDGWVRDEHRLRPWGFDSRVCQVRAYPHFLLPANYLVRRVPGRLPVPPGHVFKGKKSRRTKRGIGTAAKPRSCTENMRECSNFVCKPCGVSCGGGLLSHSFPAGSAEVNRRWSCRWTYCDCSPCPPCLPQRSSRRFPEGKMWSRRSQ